VRGRSPLPLGRRPLLGGVLAAAARPTRAQTAGWAPSRPVTIVVPFSPGGTTDVMARLIAGPMGRSFGQAVVVENVTGAGGNVGAARVARAEPDGHTALLAHIGVLSVNQHLYRNMPFDAARDFAPVGLLCTNPMLLLVSARSGIADLEGLKARARRGQLKVATSGAGSTMHLAALQFLQAVGGRADLIPYRGGGPALNDLLAGTVDMLLEQALGGTQHVLSGGAKAFAVTGRERLAALPEVPTAAEAGLSGLDIQIWNALVLPAKAPPAIIAAHGAALSAAIDDGAVQARFVELAARLPKADERTPGFLSQLMARDAERWGALLRSAGVEMEG
jgi:tripartite-type tricarboxylate transporter receptor subunit TctC